jgi:glycosyl transferase family 25
MQKVSVFVVSLKSATDRRTALQAHLAALGMDFEWFDAVRGDALSPQVRQEINPGGNMSPGQLGCYLSHIHIYEHIVEKALPLALILEDDVILHPSVVTLVRTGVQQLAFDYCFLGRDDQGDAGFVFYNAAAPSRLSERHMAYPLSSGPYCTHAYFITLEGAKKRLACAYPARSAIDHYRHLPYQPRFMSVMPMLGFVNELSAVQSMSSMKCSKLEVLARKQWWYYPLRDLLKLKAFKKWQARRLTKFPQPGRWRTFYTAFRVLPSHHLKP